MGGAEDNWKSLSQDVWNVKSHSVPSLSHCDQRQLSNLFAARLHYRTVPLQRDGWEDQAVNWQKLY